MHFEKIITASEMARVEKIAISEGESEERFMICAGEGIAKELSKILPFKKIAIVAGKGNNAGDAFICGMFLLKRGFAVRALLFFEPSSFSRLCKKSFEDFKRDGGSFRAVRSSSDIFFDEDEIIVDALFGTGFKGKVDLPFSSFIQKINSYKNFKVAIDIPSGVDGNSGEVGSVAVKADHTLYLALAKSGFFLGRGWEHVGKIHRVDFGLKKKYLKMAKASFFLVEEESILDDLPPIVRTRNKYSAGFVVAIAGSLGMEGAANLGGKAALRSGAGIVKLFIQGYRGEGEPLADELVKMELDFRKKENILSICNSASSIFIGPGIGRSEEISEFLRFLLPKLQKPSVLDADGLYFLSNNLSCPLPENMVITPHRKEMERLLHKKDLCLSELVEEADAFCQKRKLVVILKGAPTFIFKSGERPCIVTSGDPAMATAGTGDVLTGIVSALISQGMDIYSAAILGSSIHGKAGEAAARDKTSYGMIASDIIEQLPEVFKKKKA